MENIRKQNLPRKINNRISNYYLALFHEVLQYNKEFRIHSTTIIFTCFSTHRKNDCSIFNQHAKQHVISCNQIKLLVCLSNGVYLTLFVQNIDIWAACQLQTLSVTP